MTAPATPPTTTRHDSWSGALGPASQSVIDSPTRAQLVSLPQWLSENEAGALVVNSGIAHRIVWAPAEDAVAAGYSVEGAEGATDLCEVAVEALGAARALGGAWIWPVTTTDTEELAKPIGPGPHKVVAVHVVSADEAMPVLWDTDPMSPTWGRPLTLQVTPQRTGMASASRVIHASRLCYVPGLRSWGSQRTAREGYDLSALDVYRSAIDGIEEVWQSTSRLMVRRAIPWIKLAGVRDSFTTSQESGLTSRMRGIVGRMTTEALIWLGEGDETGWTAPPLTGTQESMAAMVSRLSAVEGIPVTVLMGQAPGGLTTDDAAGRRTYAALLERQRGAVEPALLQVYAIALGPGDRSLVWGPADAPSAKEAAELSLAYAQRDALGITSGAITPDESRARYAEAVERPSPVLEAPVGAVTDPSARDPDGASVAPGAEKAADTALNGAQVQAANAVISSVAEGKLPRESGVAMLARFFNMPIADAEQIMGSVGRTFTVPDASTE